MSTQSLSNIPTREQQMARVFARIEELTKRRNTIVDEITNTNYSTYPEVKEKTVNFLRLEIDGLTMVFNQLKIDK